MSRRSAYRLGTPDNGPKGRDELHRNCTGPATSEAAEGVNPMDSDLTASHRSGLNRRPRPTTTRVSDGETTSSPLDDAANAGRYEAQSPETATRTASQLHSAVPVLDRLWAKVSIPADSTACWLWTGARNRKGYAMMGVDGQTTTATRVLWAAMHGPIAAGMQVCHHCDNPPCMNPRHLFLGTAGDNARDKVAKGRAVNPLAEANAAKTHCPSGHALSGDNLFVRPNGDRACVICRRESTRRSDAKRAAARRAGRAA